MGRIRTIKPEFFVHDGLFDLEVGTRSADLPAGLPLRLAFAGLWTCADRDGIFEWRPRMLKPQVLPHDDVSFDAVLDHLERSGFVISYEVDGKKYGHIPSWKKHQSINNRESESVLPLPPTVTRQTRVTDATEGKGREGNGREEEGNGTRVADAPPIAPEMIAKKIQIETGIVTDRGFRVICDVVKREQGLGILPDAICSAMVDAWAAYQSAKPSLEFTWGAEKFFGEANWKEPKAWPWKQGAAQAPTPQRVYVNRPRPEQVQ